MRGSERAKVGAFAYAVCSPAKKNSAARVEFDKLLNENNLRIETELELATLGG